MRKTFDKDDCACLPVSRSYHDDDKNDDGGDKKHLRDPISFKSPLIAEGEEKKEAKDITCGFGFCSWSTKSTF